MRLLDLFCGAGGCSVGYSRAGFECVGVDIEPHPEYPFEFILADAMYFDLESFDAVHASPPCQAYSKTSILHDKDREELVEPIRKRLIAWGGPYVIENVQGSDLINPLLLCGSEFNLKVKCNDGVTRYLQRHRLFESNIPLQNNGGCNHEGIAISVIGHSDGKQRRGYQANVVEARIAMGIDWMKHEDITQAIPPAYTEHIGRQLIDWLTL